MTWLACSPSRILLQKLLERLLVGETLDIGDRQGGVETLGADRCTVEDGVATIELPVVIKESETLLGLVITGVSDPAVSLKKNSRAEVLVTVPPVRRA